MTESQSLDTIGQKHGTDKASIHHNYLEFYEGFFRPLRDKTLTVLEIGVLNGASLKTWEEYFANSKIIGVDIKPKSKSYATDRVSIEIADQSNLQDLINICVKYGPFDIVIEDGSHLCEHQITSLKTIFPFVKEGGIYIVEDLQTNYGKMLEKYRGVSSITCVEYLKQWLDFRVADNQVDVTKVEDPFLRTYGRGIDFMAFYRRACLIRKGSATSKAALVGGHPIVQAAPQENKIKIIAHVHSMGNVVGEEGFVDLPTNKYPIQGLSINAGGILEYKVRTHNLEWGQWTAEGEFTGSRGRSLTGVAIRLRGEAAGRLSLRVIGRFVSDVVEVSDSAECVSGELPLCGLQIAVSSRQASH